MRAWILVPCLAGAVAGAQAPPVFRGEIGLVVLQATVHNARGETVTGLPRDAFTVYEDGDRQAITMFQDGEVPISLGVLLDRSRSMSGKHEVAQSAALAALRASRRPDETFVMNFADKASLDVPLTSTLDALAAAVAPRPAVGGTALRDAIDQAADYLAAQASRPRKVLLVVSDGHDNCSVTPLDGLKRKVAGHDVAIFAIAIAGPEDPEGARRGRDALDELTELTGGTVRDASSAAEAEARGREVAGLMRHSYTIGYAPLDQALDGTYRKLRVVARGQERLRVRTRPGYRAAPGLAGFPRAR